MKKSLFNLLFSTPNLCIVGYALMTAPKPIDFDIINLSGLSHSSLKESFTPLNRFSIILKITGSSLSIKYFLKTRLSLFSNFSPIFIFRVSSSGFLVINSKRYFIKVPWDNDAKYWFSSFYLTFLICCRMEIVRLYLVLWQFHGRFYKDFFYQIKQTNRKLKTCLPLFAYYLL